jgi:hypothetical protein
MPSVYNLQPLRWGLWWRVVILKDIISRPLNYAEQNGCLKILVRSVLEIDGRGGGGLVAL